MIDLSGVAPNNTFLGLVFQSYRKGELTEREWHVASARWTSENLHHYRAVSYLPLPERSRAYVASRMNGATEYIQREAQVLGEWFKAVTEAFLENRPRMDNMRWCSNILSGVGMSDRALACDQQFDRIFAAPFPMREYESANQVKIKDQREKGRSTGLQLRGGR